MGRGSLDLLPRFRDDLALNDILDSSFREVFLGKLRSGQLWLCSCFFCCLLLTDLLQSSRLCLSFPS